MEDRLTEALYIMMQSTNSTRVKKVIQLMIDLDNELSYMDYNDYEDFQDSGDYDECIQDYTESLEQLIG